jgi:hypothetical protein
MKKIVTLTIILFLVLLQGGSIMDYNIQMMQRNANNTEWDNHYPITKAENIITANGNVKTDLDSKASKTYVDGLMASIADGSPTPFATLALLQAAYPTGDTKSHIVIEDGYLYYWNGTAWIKGWLFQSPAGDYLTAEASPNIYNKTNALNGYLVGYTPTNVQAYADSIYSGIVPVVSGKSYVISQKLKPVGYIYCYNSTVSSPSYNSGGLCAISGTGGTYGNWASPSGKITRSNNILSNGYYSTVITIIDPTIKYIAWSMQGEPYWSHTTEEFNTIINSAQVEEGTVRTEYTAYNAITYKVKEASLPDEFKKLNNNNIVVFKADNKFSVRTSFDDTTDIYNLWEYPRTDGNLGLNLIDTATCVKNTQYNKITGTSFKPSGDDIAPLYLNGSYVGANHGYYDVNVLTATGHGKTTADIGSVWNIDNKKFIILDVVDANTLKIFSDYTGTQTSPTNYLGVTSGVLTHVSGATNTSNISFTQILIIKV